MADHSMTADYFDGAPLRIGQELQLLIDNHVIEDRWRLRRRIHLPEKHTANPVLVRDRLWEAALIPNCSVFWDDALGKYRMWYSCFVANCTRLANQPQKFVCYAESANGIDWTKPSLGLHAFGEYRDTNVVYVGHDPDGHGAIVSQVFRDEADPEAARRYKMIVYEPRLRDGKMRKGVNLAVSPDGFKWSFDGEAPILDYNSDSLNHVVWDPRAQRWLLYCRPRSMHATGRQPQEPAPPHYPAGRHTSRRVSVMTSRDFKVWSYPRTCLYADELDVSDYDAATVLRIGSHFLMFYSAMDGDGAGTKDIRLASSVDGIQWERFHDRTPWLARGREGDWDAGQIMRVATNPPVTMGGDVLLFYTGATHGQYDWHGQGGVGVAITKRDRFVMQYAEDEPGFLITKEFVMEGSELRVSTWYRKTKDTLHYLRAEIVQRPELGQHAGAKPVAVGFALADCDPLKENGTDVVVTWNGRSDLSAFRGKRIYVRFELRNMGVFSFRMAGST